MTSFVCAHPMCRPRRVSSTDLSAVPHSLELMRSGGSHEVLVLHERTDLGALGSEHVKPRLLAAAKHVAQGEACMEQTVLDQGNKT